MTFAAILFDLFDTLVRFDRSRLPEVQLNGMSVRSSAGRLFPILAPHAPGLELGALVDALRWSWEEAERIRGADFREVGAPKRFGLLFRRLGLEPSRIPAVTLDALLDAHSASLAGAAELPPDHRALVTGLSRAYRLGIVSNFDWTPTARRILDREGLAGLFEAVIVSADVGWRKPKAAIFEAALGRLGLAPREALFVGDRPEIDVLGAKAAGMAAAWLNPRGEPVPPGVPAPDYELRRLTDLREILPNPPHI